MKPEIKTGTYKEEGWLARVEILEDNSDSEWDRFKLKVLGTIMPSPIFKTPEDGTIFEVDAMKKYKHYIGWSLIINA
jgi:hypothetical protein